MQNESSTEHLEQGRLQRHEALESNVGQAVAQEEDVQEAVRRLTYDALSARQLDLDSLRQIVNSVVEGARRGIQQEAELSASQVEAAQARLSQALGGLDAALAQFAEASKLTVEEAASQAQAFSEDDLSRVRGDLESLESLFLETVKNFAKATEGFVSETLRDVASHAERHGTRVGAQLRETLATFSDHMAEAGRSQISTGLQLAQATANFMRNVAAGVLTGLAERLKTGPSSSTDRDA